MNHIRRFYNENEVKKFGTGACIGEHGRDGVIGISSSARRQEPPDKQTLHVRGIGGTSEIFDMVGMIKFQKLLARKGFQSRGPGGRETECVVGAYHRFLNPGRSTVPFLQPRTRVILLKHASRPSRRRMYCPVT